MRYLRMITGCINAICLIVTILALSIQTPALGLWFYRWQFNKNATYDVLRMDEENLHHVARSTIAYLGGKTDTLADTWAVVNGAERLFYTEGEASHMDDVRVLFDYGLLARDIAAIGFAVTLAALLIIGAKTGQKKAVAGLLNLWRWFNAGFLAAVSVLGGLIALNFQRAFNIFHELFFVDNWLFNPRTSLMINMLPNAFFMNTAMFIIIMMVSLMLVTIIISAVVRRVLLKHV